MNNFPPLSYFRKIEEFSLIYIQNENYFSNITSDESLDKGWKTTTYIPLAIPLLTMTASFKT